MSFPYSSSSSNRFFGSQGDRPRQGLVRWSESQESGSSRGSRFGDHLKLRQGEEDCYTEFRANSVIEEAGRSAGGRPPSPSPICSPSNSCSPVGSPSGIQDAQRSLNGESDSRTEGSTVSRKRDESRGKIPVEESEAGARSDPSSSRCDNAPFSSHAVNPYSNWDFMPAPETPQVDNVSGEIRDIHVTVEPSRSAATNNNQQIIQCGRQPRQRTWSDTSMVSYVSSEGESISLSREFNNVLAAAAAAGTNNNSTAQAAESESLRSILEEGLFARTPPRRNTLPGIGEEEPSRTTSAEEGDSNNNGNNYRRDNLALVLTTDNNNTSAADGERTDGNREQIGGRDYLALVPVNGAPSTGSNSNRDAPSGSWDAQNNERAMINHVGNGNSNGCGSASSSARNLKEKGAVPTPKQLALAKVKRDKIEAKAVAWEEAKTAEVDNRFKREDSIITAWENEQQVKANINMKKVERKLEEKRAKAFEKMQNEIARAHRKAEERRAAAEARKGAENAKITEAVEQIRALGRLPKKFFIF